MNKSEIMTTSAPLADCLSQFVQRRGELRFALRLGLLQEIEQRRQVGGIARRRQIADDAIGHARNADGIALLHGQIPERSRKFPRRFDLGDRPRAEPHRAARIENKAAAQIRVGFEFLDVKSIRPAEDAQSSRRRSSPGTYFRYSANSTLDPRCGLGCRPDTLPCIGRRENSGTFASRARHLGVQKSGG